MRKLNKLSIVIPCHNEEEILDSSYTRLRTVLSFLIEKKMIKTYELLFVNNGSTDSTENVLMNIFDKDELVRVVTLRKNFGYQGSISAGLYHSDGDAVVTIDSDLQDPPEKIEEMVQHYQNGYDLVLGVKTDRSTDSWAKRFFSENYYRVSRILGVNIEYNHGDFRLMSSELVKEYNKLKERNRLIRGLVFELESKYEKVYYKREKREVGKTKFSPSDLFGLSLDGFVSFSFAPLRVASFIGLFICFLSIISSIWVLYQRFTSEIVPGWASITLPIFALGGIQLLILGIIGEYIGRLYTEVKERPLFIVKKEYTHN